MNALKCDMCEEVAEADKAFGWIEANVEEPIRIRGDDTWPKHFCSSSCASAFFTNLTQEMTDD